MMTTGPTDHSGTITASETWTAATGPHTVSANLSIESDAVVTIEPCVGVEVAADVRIVVGSRVGMGSAGTLIAEGTGTRPITFSARDATAWDNLRVVHPGQVRLANVTLTGAGADTITYDGATIVAYGDSALPLKPLLMVTDVTIAGSQGYGILMARMASFAAGSTGLTISGSGATLPAHEQPIYIGAHALGTLPPGTYTGNATDEILINPLYSVENDMTIADLGVPYHVEGAAAGTLAMTISRDFGNPMGPIPVLTVAAGVIMEFGRGAALRIGTHAAGANQAGFVVQGTATQPVVFTSDATAPASGDWRGIVVYDPMGATVSIDYAHIEYAAQGSFCQSFACGAALDVPGGDNDAAALSFCDWQPDPAGVMRNSTVSDSAGWGVLRGWGGLTTGPDFTDPAANNTFTNVAYCAQSMRNRDPTPGSGESCPVPRPLVPSECLTSAPGLF